MRVRSRWGVTSTALVLAVPLLAAVAAPAVAEAQVTLDWCSPTSGVPCIESATVTESPGATPHVITPTDATYAVQATEFFTDEGLSYLSLWGVPTAGGYLPDSATDDVWSITVDLGTSLIPRVVDGTGRNASVTRTYGYGYRVTITGTPVKKTGFDPSAYCDQSVWPWTCPATAGGEEVLFGAFVSDVGTWTDETQRLAFYGMDYWSNIEAGALPPQLVPDGSGGHYLEIDVANSANYSDGTPFLGSLSLTVPYRFLEDVYGVEDAEAMTASSLKATIGGTPAHVAQSPAGDAVVVTADEVTFPVLGARSGRAAPYTKVQRVLVKRGWLVSRVGDLKAVRLSATKARIGFRAASNRGAKVTGYQVRCTPKAGRVVTGSVKRPPILLTGLRSGTKYSCTVRANWKHGHGRWSVPVTLSKRP